MTDLSDYGAWAQSARKSAESALDVYVSDDQVERELALHLARALRELAALLAVGERDKGEIERLAGIESAARAYLDAEDADEEAVDRLIAEDDTDGSLSEAQALTRANADAASDALRAVLAGGESPGERDRRQIARLTEALEQIAALPSGKQRQEDERCGYCHFSFASSEPGCAMCSTGGSYAQARNAWRVLHRDVMLLRRTVWDAPVIARAVLADEEDADT